VNNIRFCLLLGMLTLVSGLNFAAFQPVGPEKDAPDGVEAANVERFVPPAIPFITPVDEQVLTLAFSPDGKKLVTAGARHENPGQLKVWDVQTAQELVAVRGFSGVRSIAWSTDGKTLATGDFSGAVRLRDADTGAERATVKGHKIGINAVAYSFDGKMLVSAGLDRVVKLWNAADLQERKEFVGHGDMVFSAAFFRHGQAFVTTSRDNTAKIWDIAAGKERHTLRGHRQGVEAAAISPDDKMVATASWDKTVRLWDADSGAEKGILQGHVAGVLAVAFSPDGKWLASAGYDLVIRIWDVEKQKQVGTLGKHNSVIWTLAFSRDGVLASGSSDTTAKLWNVADRKEIALLPTSDRKPIEALAYASDGKVVGIAKDKTVQLCYAKTGDLLRVLRGHTGVVTCLAFSPKGDMIASGSADQTVKLWDDETGKVRSTLPARPGAVTALVFTLDGKKIAVGRDDGSVHTHSPATGEVIETIKPDVGPILALAYAPDGRLAIGGANDALKILYPAKKGVLDSLPGHTKSVRALAFSADGVLASASDDGTVKVWERNQAKERFTLKGHEGAVAGLTFSSTGKTLISGGADGTVRLWDPGTGQAAGTLRRHTAPVTALAMHPAGADLLSGSKDTLVLRWPRAVADIPPLPLIFRHDFRGTKINKEFLKFATKDDAKRYVQEAEGLRVSPPVVVPRGGPSGVMTTFRLRGDFDVSASYEILQADIPEIGSPIGVSLYITTDTPTQDAVMLTRFNRQDGSHYTCSGIMTTQFGQNRQFPPHKLIPTDVVAGQLRLIRQGKVVRFLVADEGSDGFQELRRLDLGDEDVLYVRLAADPGSKDSPPVVARLRSIEVRGQVGAPKAPPDVVVKSPEKKSAPNKHYAQEYRQQFKETLEKIPGWQLMMPKAAAEVQSGPEGLRITMPTGHEQHRQGVGLQTEFGIKGDCEITLRYEMLKEPEPQDVVFSGTSLRMRVDLQNPSKSLASLGRGVQANEGTRFTSYGWKNVEAKETHFKAFPAKAKKGQLRLVRSGAVLSYYAAEEASDDFVFLFEHPFGDEDLKRVCIAGSTGGPKSALDVRVTDFRIRADGLLIPPKLAASVIVNRIGAPKTPPTEVVVKSPAKKSAPNKNYAQEYRQQFKETLEKIPGWQLMMPKAAAEVQSGPDGLRITMPTGHEQLRQGVGLQTEFGIKGDCEITLRYEMLKEPEPRDVVFSRTGLSMRVDLENASKSLASLTRGVQAKEGMRFISFGWKNVERKVTHFAEFPAQAKKGQLRMVRNGTILCYYAAEEGSDDFVFLFEHPFGDEDLKRVCIAGSTGGPKSALDVRVTDFRIRADGLLVPPELAGSVIVNQPNGSGPVAVPVQGGGAQNEASSRGWLIAVILIVMVLALCFAAALGLWFFLRQRNAPASPPAAAPKKLALIAFPCPGCGKNIKAKPGLTGKKIKCPRCGKVVTVAPPETDAADLPVG
jgi:WD40 repeat protein